MKLFSLDFGFGSRLLLIVLALLSFFGVSGCASEASSEKFAADVATGVKAIRDLGVEADGEIYLSPNGNLALIQGVQATNSSYAIIRIKADPAKAALQDKATK